MGADHLRALSAQASGRLRTRTELVMTVRHVGSTKIARCDVRLRLGTRVTNVDLVSLVLNGHGSPDSACKIAKVFVERTRILNICIPSHLETRAAGVIVPKAERCNLLADRRPF